MKTVNVAELEEGLELFDQPFLLLEVNPRKTRDGRPYILFNIGDKTGQVGGVFWNVPDEVIESCKAGSVVLVTGSVRVYNTRLQVTALDLQPYEPESMSAYVPSTERDQDEMVEHLRTIIAGLREPLQQLLTDVMLREPFLGLFTQAPAGRSMHHSYVGGLLEHCLTMVRFCELAAELYPHVDRDLLVAGALTHDIGKVYAYEMQATFPITDEEKLVGHVTGGALMLDKAMERIPDFPAKLRDQVLHLAVSNHGLVEWGSPVNPRTLEAVLLSQIDLLDSRAKGFADHIDAEPGKSTWTSRSQMFGYELMRKHD